MRALFPRFWNILFSPRFHHKIITPAKAKWTREERTKWCLQSYRLQLFMLQRMLSKTGLSYNRTWQTSTLKLGRFQIQSKQALIRRLTKEITCTANDGNLPQPAPEPALTSWLRWGFYTATLRCFSCGETSHLKLKQYSKLVQDDEIFQHK